MGIKRIFTGIFLLSLFLGPIISGISVETIFPKLDIWELLTITVKEDFTLLDDHTADFDFLQKDSCATEPVEFTNTSTGDDLSYSWDFGDPNSKEKNSSTQKDPSHTFVGNPGNGTQTFTVTLTVEDSEGNPEVISKKITLKQSPSLEVGSDKDETTFDNLPFYIVCENNPSEFTFYNNSSTKDTNVNYEIDWGDGSPKYEGEEWTSFNHTYDLGIYKITYTITGENGCVATKNYQVFVGSNPAVGFGNPGNTNICTGESLSFPITGAENNPPGTKYTITFSDGSDPQIFDHPPPASVEHIFQGTSCGVNSTDFPNSFSARIIAENPCSASSATVTPIYVSEAPIPEIKLPTEAICVDSPTPIDNLTVFGNEVSNNGLCSDQGKFIWEITPDTGWELSNGSMGSRPDANEPNSWAVGSSRIIPIFTEAGTYTITLISGNRCGIQEKEETICVMPEPVPSFTLDQEEGCGPLQVKATNESNTLGVCGAGSYDWTVAYTQGDCGTRADWGFENGSDRTSENPVFNFNNPGEYTINLAVKANCGSFTEQKTVRIYAPPSVAIEDIKDVCGPTAITPKANVIACGSTDPVYKWTFEDGVPATSDQVDPGPVEFTTPGTKSVSLEVTTSCGTIVGTDTFLVNEPPVVDAGQDLEICHGEEITLTPTITPEANYSFRWSSVPSGVNSNLANPTVAPKENTTYTLTVTDQESGCTLSDEVTVAVIPAPVLEFSIPNQTICSGETTLPVSIVSIPTGATIGWKAESDGVTGFGESGTSEIPAQTLVNNGDQPRKVTYTATITSSDLGECSVVPANYTITVNPAPPYADEQLDICSGSLFEFTPENHIPGTLYTWTTAPVSNISGSSDSEIPQNSLSQTLTNNGNTSASITYTITPVLGLCPGEDFELTVMVQPSPAINFSIPDQEICSGSPTEEVTLSSEVPEADFFWISKPNGVEGAIPSGNSNRIPIQNLVNPTDQAIVVEYEITASTDSQNSCEGVPKMYTITVNPAIKINPTVSDFSGYQISCNGAEDGFIEIDPSGGSGNYQITWSGPNGFNSSNPRIQNLPPGIYNLDIRETPPFNIRWSNGESVQNLTGLSAGQYGVEVEDASGCTVSSQFQVKRPDPLGVTAFRSAAVSCEPREIQEEIRVSVDGGMAPYTINWSGGSVSEDGRVMTTNRPGFYLLNVTDGNGCQYQESFEVKNSEVILDVEMQSTAFDLHRSYLVNFDIQFVNLSVGQISTFFWDFGDGNTSFEENPKHTYLSEGDHEVTLTVTDLYGCETTMKKKIQVFDYFLVTPNVFTPNGDGVNDYFFPKFLNIEQLEFWVLNKWGETIYHTDNLASEGWNGQVNGEPALPGNYVYKLDFQTLDGRKQTKSEVFLLLK